MFSDLSIQRLDKNSQPITDQLIKVPITFSPKQKWLVRLSQDPNAGAVLDDGSPIQKQVQITLPRMGYELHDLKYDPTRKLQSINKNVKKNASKPGALDFVYNPVPFIFPFELSIATKNLDDLYQIIEQILPFFTPTLSVTIEESPLPLSKDIVLTYTGISIQDSPYGDMKDKRILTASLTFDLAGYLYGPQRIASIIKEVDLRYFAVAHPISNNNDNEDNTYVASGFATVAGYQETIAVSPKNTFPGDNTWDVSRVITDIITPGLHQYRLAGTSRISHHTPKTLTGKSIIS